MVAEALLNMLQFKMVSPYRQAAKQHLNHGPFTFLKYLKGEILGDTTLCRVFDLFKLIISREDKLWILIYRICIIGPRNIELSY